MFEEAGSRCPRASTRHRTVQSYDVIVWAPDDFRPPGSRGAAVLRASGWRLGKRKTLVYIGRDYDAAPYYWEAVLPAAPAAERLEVMRRQARAAAQHDGPRLDMPRGADHRVVHHRDGIVPAARRRGSTGHGVRELTRRRPTSAPRGCSRSRRTRNSRSCGPTQSTLRVSTAELRSRC